ncbi:MAG: MYXO-CTERM sorting domain-containing protein [bacterium]
MKTIAVLFALALVAAASPARADVFGGATFIIEDDTPACLVVQGADQVDLQAWIVVENGCEGEAVFTCPDEVACQFEGEDAALRVLRVGAGERRTIGASGYGGSMAWAVGEAAGAIEYSVETASFECGTEEFGCSAQPGAVGRGAGWMALGVLGVLLGLRRRRAG